MGEDEPEQTAGRAANRPPLQGNVLDANGYTRPPHPQNTSFRQTHICKSDSSLIDKLREAGYKK